MSFNKTDWIALSAFFGKKENFNTLSMIKKRSLCSFLGSKISLRMIEFLLTNYSLLYPISYVVAKKPDNPSSLLLYSDSNFKSKKQKLLDDGYVLNDFNLRVEYKRQIKQYQKIYFDPCCRAKPNEKFTFKNEHGIIENTALKQMVFFRWAISNCVIEWLKIHLNQVKKAMKDEEKAKLDAKVLGKRQERITNIKYKPRETTLKRKRSKLLSKTGDDPSSLVFKRELETWGN